MQAKVLRCELKVEGMFCSSCELRIEQALYKLDGIINVEASYSGSVVRIAYDQDVIQLPEIVAAIEAEDYRVKPIPGHTGIKIDMERRIGEEPTSVNQVLGIIIILFALYLIVRNTIGFNFIPQVDQSMGYGILFLVGVLTSLHCISMCGGINLSQCVGHDFSGDEDNKLARLKPSFMYNLGRVISYTIIGGIVGALGSAVSFSGTAKGVVALVAGAFMIIMGINMLNLFPGLRKFNPRLPRFFGNKTNSHNGRRKPLYVGLLNGLMPCGPLQAMQIYALAAGSFMAGAVSMLAFSLGTVPLMFGFGAISSLLSARFTKQMMKASAVLVIFLGLIMLNRGLSLGGFNVLAAVNPPDSMVAANVAKVEGDVQTIAMTMDSGRYSPIVVQKGIPVRWTISAEKSDLNGCNNPVTIPKYDIEKKLVPGDNLIEFTPVEAGNITYTCWMGMISSTIKVVDDISVLSDQDLQQLNTASPGTARGGCCSR